MKVLLCSIFCAVMLAACGGSDAEIKPVPEGAVSGIAFDGLVRQGSVSVYDYTTGKKGKLLANTTTGDDGLYQLKLQIESRPLLIELTGGMYTEEADAFDVALTDKTHRLTAVVNYKTGAELNVAVTSFTHLAAGLTEFNLRQGNAVATAIDNANSKVTSFLGWNILTTIPKDVTNPTSATATLTPAHKYGFLAAGISRWTLGHAVLDNFKRRLPDYSSIVFAQLIYSDIAADGVLDGYGIDDVGAKKALSFGAVALTPDVYRRGIGVGTVQFAQTTNNKTAISPIMVYDFAKAYAEKVDSLFGTAAPESFVNGDARLTGTGLGLLTGQQPYNVCAQFSSSSQFGVGQVEYLIDGKLQATITNPASHKAEDVSVTYSAFNSYQQGDDAYKARFELYVSSINADGGAMSGYVCVDSSGFDQSAPHLISVRMKNGLGQYVSSSGVSRYLSGPNS